MADSAGELELVVLGIPVGQIRLAYARRVRAAELLVIKGLDQLARFIHDGIQTAPAAIASTQTKTTSLLQDVSSLAFLLGIW